MHFNSKLKYFLIGFLVSFSVFSYRVYVRQGSFNKDDMTHKMSFPFIDKKIIENKTNPDLFIIFVGSSRCPGRDFFLTDLEKNIKVLKEKNIKSFLIYDEVFRKSEDENLKLELSSHNISEPGYLLNPNEYGNRQGIYNGWRRYHNFIKAFDTNFPKDSLSYPKYFVFKNKKLLYYEKSLNFQKLIKNLK